MSEIKIKQLREDRNLTQAQLAAIMGVSVQTIKNWESGKVIPSTSLMKLKQVFDIDSVDSSNVANNINGDINQNSGKVIDALIKQLDVKDKQIEILLNLIEKLKK